MRRYLSALRARQGEISRGRILMVLLISLVLIAVVYVALSFIDWDRIRDRAPQTSDASSQYQDQDYDQYDPYQTGRTVSP
jgi:hypothetical protein